MNAAIETIQGRFRLAVATIAISISFSLMFTAFVGKSSADDPAKAIDPAAKAAAAFYEGMRAETLPNGLLVYLKQVDGAPVVTTMLAYKVRSADEELDHTGLSHYLQHLI